MAFPIDLKRRQIPVIAYSTGVSEFTPAATPTDVFAIQLANYDRNIRLKRVSIAATADTATNVTVLLQSAPNGGGGTTVSTPTRPHDGMSVQGFVYPNNVASTFYYTVNGNPSQRNGVSNSRPILKIGTLNIGTASVPTQPCIFEFEIDKMPTIRDLTTWFVLNLKGQTLPANTKLSVDVEWYEQRCPRVSFVGDSTFFAAGTMYSELNIGGVLPDISNIDNLGSNGYRAIDYIDNLNGVTYPQSVVVPNRSKDVLVLGYGINDLREGAATLETMISRLESIINTTITASPDCRIILCAPNMITSDDFESRGYVKLEGIFAGLTMPQAAQLLTDMLYEAYEHFRDDPRIFAIFQRQDVTGRISVTVANSKGLMKDQLHPSDRGNTLIGRKIYPIITKAVNSVLTELNIQ